MVGKWSVKNPLTLEERIKIKEGLDKGLSYAQLSEYVGRPKSTIRKECKCRGRAASIEEYDPVKAQMHFEETQRNKLLNLSKSVLK